MEYYTTIGIDARELARLAIADVGMLHPVKLRAEVYQQMLRLHNARQLLIKTRTAIINQVRGFGKSAGFRIVWSSTEKFHEQPRTGWPEHLETVAAPLMKTLKETDRQLGITHAGLDIVRKVLVECANVVMKASAKDTDLKFKGMRIAQSGGRIAKKKAKVAVA